MSKNKTRRLRKEYSDKQIERLKKDSRMKGAKDALIVSVAAMADELKLDDEQIGKVATRLDRYTRYLDEHAVRIKEVKEIIENQTGIRFG